MRSIRLLLLLTLVFGLITLNSCKKDKETVPLGTISATIDGIPMNFNTDAVALRYKGNIDGTIFTTIRGYKPDNSIMQIVMYSAVTAGKTYHKVSDDQIHLSFGFVYTITNDGNIAKAFEDDKIATNPISITITAVSSTSVSGTFKGNLIKTMPFVDSIPTKETRSITNGKFNVAITTL